MIKLLIPCHMPFEVLNGFEDFFEFIYPSGKNNFLDEEELRTKIRKCDVFLAMGHRIDRTLLMTCPKIKIIANLGVGYDNIECEAASDLGVCIINTPDSATQSVAELTIAMILNMLRHIYKYQKQVHDTLTCNLSPFPAGSATAFGKTLGIIGLGRIGKAVAKKAVGLGMKVIYYDICKFSHDIENKLEVTYLPFDDFIEKSDIITLHCPYNSDTHHLISSSVIKRMKKGAYIVNISRGGLVCESDLAAAVKSKHIAGAAIDVHEFEPKINAELSLLENVVLTPHIGSGVYETRVNMVKEALEGAVSCIKGIPPSNLVNPSVWENFIRKAHFQ